MMVKKRSKFNKRKSRRTRRYRRRNTIMSGGESIEVTEIPDFIERKDKNILSVFNTIIIMPYRLII